MKPRPGLRLALCAAGASATLGLAACGSGEHSAPTANASATTSAATAPADVRTPSGRVFPGEGAQVPPHSHTGSAAAGRSAASAGRSIAGPAESAAGVSRSVARTGRPARSASRSTHSASRPAANRPAAAAGATTVVTGRYVGPPHNGANPCGYVAVGPGLEQASAFVVHGVNCATARTLAADKRHLPAGGRSYSALGFDCVSVASAPALRRFSCTAGAAAVSFVVS
jgi:hypothetical protein